MAVLVQRKLRTSLLELEFARSNLLNNINNCEGRLAVTRHNSELGRSMKEDDILSLIGQIGATFVWTMNLNCGSHFVIELQFSSYVPDMCSYTLNTMVRGTSVFSPRSKYLVLHCVVAKTHFYCSRMKIADNVMVEIHESGECMDRVGICACFTCIPTE